MRTLTFPGQGDGYPYPSRPLSRPISGAGAFHWNGRKILRGIFYTLLLGIFAAGAAALTWTAHALKGLNHDLTAILTYKPGEATLLYASDGTLLARVAKENRVYVSLDRIPTSMRNATVATEDRRFWQHSGVDLRGLGRALWRDLHHGRAAEGGSTLTMQLVRNIQLTPDKTLERKVREAALAVQLERVYEKPRLLEMYLNQVFYGNGAYGVGAAARTYFGKPAGKLSVAQSALLATLPRRPTVYNPFRDPDGSLTRRNRLLKEMAAQGYLTPQELNLALKEPLGVKRSATPSNNKAPYFVDAVVDRLVELYGAKAVYQGGLRVYTTVNPMLQAEAEEALRRGVRNLGGGNGMQGALVSIDPFTAEVKALVGGVDYRRSPFNRALARRQPGSAFKPFVYATAFDMGLSPMDRVTDSPVRLSNWSPKNYNHRYAGRVTVGHAFAMSLNVPAVKLAMTAGIPQVSNVARACGIRSPLRNLPSLSLGTSEVSPLELTSAYGAFATMGQWGEPKLIRRVEDREGKVLHRFNQFPGSVLTPLTAQKVDYCLRAAVEGGTAKPVASVPRARGKTGTTQDHKDVWFVGYTPELVTGVWLGHDRPVRMSGLWGSTGCAPIWKRYMSRALATVPKRQPMPLWTPPKPEKAEEDAEKDTSLTDPTYQDAPEWRGEPSPAEEMYGAAVYPQEAGVREAAEAPVTRWKTIRLCPETGEKAGPNCPNTVSARIGEEDNLPVCAFHAPSEEPDPWAARASLTVRGAEETVMPEGR